MASREKVIRKIKACLALAQSGNSAEAATALRQAQALMRKHGIGEMDVSLAAISTQRTNTGAGKQLAKYKVQLVHLINSAFGTDVILHPRHSNGRWQSDFLFVGFDSTPELASYCYDVLDRQLSNDRRCFFQSLRKQIKRSTRIRRADLFAEGWVHAVSNKVTAFALSDDQRELLNHYKQKTFGALEVSQARDHSFKKYDHSAYFDGRDAGDKADLFHGVTPSQQEYIGQAQ